MQRRRPDTAELSVPRRKGRPPAPVQLRGLMPTSA
jgi:hypothetical protein